MGETQNEWRELGSRLTEARKVARLSQAEVGAAVGLDRTAITRIEAGERRLDSLELVRIAALLARPLEWFLAPALPAMVSLRQSREPVDESQSDALLDSIARDVKLLFDIGLLDAPAPLPTKLVDSVESAEVAAQDLRRHLQMPEGPVWGLVAVAERAGLFGFCLPLPDARLDGSFLRLDQGGVAVVNGAAKVGRRRFTLVHELGHHVFADDFSGEWIVGSGSEDRERLINAFVIHFLMPRGSVIPRWKELGGAADPRQAAIVLGAEFGVSWTAVLGHLRNLELVDEHVRERLLNERPGKADYLEGAVVLHEDLVAPLVPPRYAQAVVRAFRRHKISQGRAIELLRGTVSAGDLPGEDRVPLESMRAQFDLD